MFAYLWSAADSVREIGFILVKNSALAGTDRGLYSFIIQTH